MLPDGEPDDRLYASPRSLSVSSPPEADQPASLLSGGRMTRPLAADVRGGAGRDCRRLLDEDDPAEDDRAAVEGGVLYDDRVGDGVAEVE